MKDFIKDLEELKKNPKLSALAFFGFYALFFLILFLVIHFAGDRNALIKEYEMGNGSSPDKGVLSKNFVYDYKITKDGVLYDYYGKRYGETERFKFNNLDYYRENDEFFVNKGTWTKCDNPYQFYEFIDLDKLTTILSKATLMTNNELNNGIVEYHYLISNNTLYQILYNENTDYDDENDIIDVIADETNNNLKITFQLDHFCSHRNNCQTLTIEMNYEMFGSVTKIDKPIV